MNVKTREALKRMVMKSGLKPLTKMEYVSALLRFRQWLEANDRGCPRLPGRPEIYQYAHDELLRGQPMDYLEFGVYQGYSMGLQVGIDTNPASRFWGFDSFEGLPEAWTTFNRTLDKGLFSTAGQVPQLNDPRVTWVKGWFQDTLPGFCRDFQPRAGNRLVLHCDADLYSSTLYALSVLNPFIDKGTLILFDEFDSVEHEFRAVIDYMSAFRRKLAPRAFAGPFYNQAALEVVE